MLCQSWANILKQDWVKASSVLVRAIFIFRIANQTKHNFESKSEQQAAVYI